MQYTLCTHNCLFRQVLIIVCVLASTLWVKATLCDVWCIRYTSICAHVHRHVYTHAYTHAWTHVYTHVPALVLEVVERAVQLVAADLVVPHDKVAAMGLSVRALRGTTRWSL